MRQNKRKDKIKSIIINASEFWVADKQQGIHPYGKDHDQQQEGNTSSSGSMESSGDCVLRTLTPVQDQWNI